MLFTCGFALTACGSSRGADGKLIELIVRLSKTEEIEMKNLKFKPSFVLTIVVILVGCLNIPLGISSGDDACALCS
jgi:hypothetical protein